MTRCTMVLARLSLSMVLGITACGGDAVIPSSTEPLVYLVLNHRTAVTPDEPQRAFLLTAGNALASEYRRAERFDMRRRSDGRAFAWRDTGRSGRAPGYYAGTGLNEGNYVLPDSTGAGLGALDLRPGETYDLHIETDGIELRGSVMIPERFQLTFGGSDGRTVSWPRVRGAAAYTVEARGVTAPELQLDTTFVIPPDRRAASPDIEVVVQAVSPEVYRYQTDQRLGRAGIDRGYGVFGALSRSSGLFRSAHTQTPR